MKEVNLLGLAQTFIMSRIVYVAPYLKLKQVERNKLDTILDNKLDNKSRSDFPRTCPLTDLCSEGYRTHSMS